MQSTSHTTTSTSKTGGGTMHNIAEKIKHPLTHDTDTNITYQTREQKKLAETNPQLAGSLGVNDVGVPPATTTGTMLNQPTFVPSTHSNIGREQVYQEKKWY